MFLENEFNRKEDQTWYRMGTVRLWHLLLYHILKNYGLTITITKGKDVSILEKRFTRAFSVKLTNLR